MSWDEYFREIHTPYQMDRTPPDTTPKAPHKDEPFVAFWREAREKTGLSYKMFSARIGISSSVLSSIENGKSRPTWRSCQGLADYLKIPVEHVAKMCGVYVDPESKTGKEWQMWLKRNMKDSYHTPKTLAEITNVSERSILSILRAETMPTQATLNALYAEFDKEV